MKTKVKVIEIVGQKLDPKAKYIFMVHVAAMPGSELHFLAEELQRLIGDNFVFATTDMPIDESMKVFEVLPKGSSDV